MSRVARKVLCLTHCPQCGYDLAGLPRRHNCPECGFAYDESMFVVVPFDRPGAEASFDFLDLVIGLILFVVFAAFAGAIGLAFRRASGMGCLVFLLLPVAIVLVRRVRVGTGSSQSQHPERTRAIIFTTEGVQKLMHMSRRPKSWQRFSRVRCCRVCRCGLRRPKSALLNVDLVRRRHYRLKIIHRGWRRIVLRPTLLSLWCSKREAALIRNEIRRRIRAARSTATTQGRVATRLLVLP